MAEPGLVERYLSLGLRLGRHIDGMVDAYYGPPELAAAVNAEPVHPPEQLVAEARALLTAIDGGGALDVLTLGLHRRGARHRPAGTGCGPR